MKTVNGFTLEQMKGGGWTEDALKKHPEYKAFFELEIPSQPTVAPVAPVTTTDRGNLGKGIHTSEDMQNDASDVEFGGLDFEALVLETHNDKRMRFVGPYGRGKRHWIECDDGTVRPFNCGYVADGGRCLIEDVTDPLIGDGSFELVTDPDVKVKEGEKPRKKRYYKWKEYNPSLIAELLGEGASNKNSWFSKELFLFNCIDRDSNWCAKSKHLKILCKSAKTLGIGPNLFLDINGQARIHGDYYTFDYTISKAGSGRSTKYTASIAPGDEARNPLTDEERQYKPYDLASFIEPSTRKYILENLAEKLMEIIGFCKKLKIVTQAQIMIEKEIIEGGYVKNQASTKSNYTPPTTPVQPQTSVSTPVAPVSAPVAAPEVPTAPLTPPVAPEVPVAPASAPVAAPEVPTASLTPPVAPEVPVAPALAPVAAPVAPEVPTAPLTPPVAPEVPVAPVAAPVASEVPTAPLTPPMAPVPAPVAPVPSTESSDESPVDNSVDVAGSPGLQCASCGTVNDLNLTTCKACGGQLTPF